MTSRFGRPLLAAFLAVLGAGVVLPAPAAAQQTPTTCTPIRQTLFVRDVLYEYYLYVREMTRKNPARYRGPEDYLEAVRYRDRDASFSYIADAEEDTLFFDESRFIGMGFSTAISGSEMRLTEVYAGSPADAAGLRRGDRITEINGQAVSSLISSGQIGTAFGAATIGLTVSMRVVSVDGTARTVAVTKQLVTIPTVANVKLFTVDGRRVGYFSFRNFVRPSFEALDAAAAQFLAAGIDELVVDVRYNGGGLVSVAQFLGGLLGGLRTNGQVFTEFVHNDRNQALNETIRFELPEHALTLDRVFVITTRSSASASELIINALRPFMTVVTVGDRTFGKPVGQYSFDFCDKVFHPVAFATRNARGEGDYFNGIAPTCPAADDISRPLGDPLEASLAEALGYVRTERCGAAAAAGLGPRREVGEGWRGEPVPAGGFRQLVNAW